MKTIMILSALLTLAWNVNAQNGVGLNTDGSAPHNSAILDVKSENKGFLPPRLSTAERNAINSPAIGLMIFNTDVKCMQWYKGNNEWHDGCSSNVPPVGLIVSLNCAGATNNGTLAATQSATGVSSVISYTGGNGISHNGQIVESTGVIGLTATLLPGTFNNGAGTLTYTITGTPTTSGTASFAISIGGQSCTLTRTVAPAPPTYPSGTVHCIPTPTVIAEVIGAAGRTWMDRNLGASRIAQTRSDTQSFGDLYQWGRRADGHQCRNSGTTTTISTTAQPDHGDYITVNGNWLNTLNNSLWQGVNGTNNPCPTGFRLPTRAEWNAEAAAWASTADRRNDAFNSPLKIPSAGFRVMGNGNVSTVESGFYWSSTVSTDTPANVHRLSVNEFVAGADGSAARAQGGSVRCIKN